MLTGENWNTVMYDCWRGTNWAATVYFISLVVFGNFIVMNLFLAILLGNFEDDGDDEDEQELRQQQQLQQQQQQQQRQQQQQLKKGGEEAKEGEDIQAVAVASRKVVPVKTQAADKVRIDWWYSEMR